MSGSRVLGPFGPIPVGSALLHLDRVDPVGALTEGPTTVFLQWREAIVPSAAFSSSIFPVHEGAWIKYSPRENLAHYPEQGVQNTAVFITAAGMVLTVALGTRRAVGADDRGLWTAEAESTVLEPPYFGGEPPEGWVTPVELIRYNADGSFSRVTIDRPVNEIQPAEGGIRIFFEPTPPVAAPTSSPGGTTYSYPIESIDVLLPTAGHVAIAVDDHTRTRVTDNLHEFSFVTETYDGEAREQVIHPILIPESLHAEWPLVELADEDITAVTERAMGEFSSLEAYWRRGDQTRPISDYLSNSTCRLEGNWPEVALVVEFDHSKYPHARFRRVIQLFAQGGRPALSNYAGLYFQEDLDTKRVVLTDEPNGDFIGF